MKQPKLCIDCQHCVNNPIGPDCIRPGLGMDPVTGEQASKSCSFQRTGGWLLARLSPYTCGKEGRFWEKKEETGASS